MNLRQARMDDHWRHVYAREYATRFTRITLRRLLCLADAPVEFSGGMSAVIGSNGVGKSTLIAGVAELLANGSEVSPGHRNRTKGSMLEGTAFADGIEVQMIVQDDETTTRKSTGANFGGSFRWLDPSYLANLCLNQIHADHNFEDLLGPVTPLQLTTDELALVSYLVNRNYDGLAIYEIADYAGFESFPYFRASSEGVVYGSEAMGRGELSLLLTYWTLRNMERDSILILEEPETHVSPRSQDCLMNILAKYVDEMGIWCILATHSPTIVRRIPREKISLITRDAGVSRVINNPRHVDIAAVLGGGVALRGVILVEDEEAKGVVLTILEELDPDLLHQFEVIPAGDEAKITSALRFVPITKDWFTFVGAYDGDQRATQRRETGWPIIFLPGDVAPGEMLKAVLETTADIRRKLAAEFHKKEESVSVALDQVAGADHHDIVSRFARAIDLPVAVVRRGLVRIWLAEGSNDAAARGFIKQLGDAVDSTIRE